MRFVCFHFDFLVLLVNKNLKNGEPGQVEPLLFEAELPSFGEDGWTALPACLNQHRRQCRHMEKLLWISLGGKLVPCSLHQDWCDFCLFWVGTGPCLVREGVEAVQH